MLKSAKYDVQAVPGPKEAIEIVRSVAPQLILMEDVYKRQVLVIRIGGTEQVTDR